MLDAARLRSFPIPSKTVDWTTRDSVIYALSVGIGHEPGDAGSLAFVTETDDTVALPSMATVMAMPGFWVTDPAAGVREPHKLLHGEQWLELLAPLPPQGRFGSETRLVGLRDRGAGRDALAYLATDLSAGGQPVARLLRSLVLRGQGGFGAAHELAFTPPPGRAPEGAPVATIDITTRPEQALIYALNGDINPLHYDPAVAAAAGFARPILHGLCTYAIAARAVIAALCGGDPARLRGLGVRFSGVVYPGETVSVSVFGNNTFTAHVHERDSLVLSNGTVDVI